MVKQAERVPPGFSLNERELFVRLGWLIQMRWLVLGLMLFGLLYAQWLYGAGCALVDALFPMAGAVAVYNLIFAGVNYRLLHVWRPSHAKNVAFAWVQIVTDLLVLSVVVHLTGGVQSVFVILYMVHLVTVSALLRRSHAFAIGLLTILLLDGIVFLEQWSLLPRHHYEGFTIGAPRSSTGWTPMLFSVCLIYNAAFLFTLYVSSTISNRLRQRGEDMEKLNARLADVDRVKSEFMRMTSHEMRSPLMAVKGLVSMIERRTLTHSCDAECRQYILRCRNRLDAMQELISDLLLYSRLQTPRDQPSKDAVDLGKLVRRVAEDLEPVAVAQGIDFRGDIADCLTRGDDEQLRILAKNLIGNALRYTPGGGSVHVLVREESDHVSFQVSDTGIGIDEESLPLIFEEFFRAPDAKEREPGGTGLGLTLCKRIVEEHQGEIHVQSKRGEGSVFTVRLPLFDEDGVIVA
jgi:signal transduction histidine kinase